MSTRNPMVRLPQDEGSESGVELLDVNDDEPEGGAPPSSLAQFDPSQLAGFFLSGEDDAIRNRDVPERLQLAYPVRRGERASERVRPAIARMREGGRARASERASEGLRRAKPDDRIFCFVSFFWFLTLPAW